MNAEKYSKERREEAAARIKALPPEEQGRLKKMLEAYEANQPEEREAQDLINQWDTIGDGIHLMENMEEFVGSLKMALDLDVEAKDELDKRLEIVTSQVEAIMELCPKALPPNPSLKKE